MDNKRWGSGILPSLYLSPYSYHNSVTVIDEIDCVDRHIGECGRMKLRVLAALLSVFFLGSTACTVTERDDFALAKVHDSIENQYPSVRHINRSKLSTIDKGSVVLFDVREEEEFAVSHLENAVRVDPDISAQEFIDAFGKMALGKTAVFYCSVGQRSSDLANRVQSALIAMGARAAYNLEGGAFLWHNENGPLVTGNAQPTKFVHPFNQFWGRMIKKQNDIRYDTTTARLGSS